MSNFARQFWEGKWGWKGLPLVRQAKPNQDRLRLLPFLTQNYFQNLTTLRYNISPALSRSYWLPVLEHAVRRSHHAVNSTFGMCSHKIRHDSCTQFSAPSSWSQHSTFFSKLISFPFSLVSCPDFNQSSKQAGSSVQNKFTNFNRRNYPKLPTPASATQIPMATTSSKDEMLEKVQESLSLGPHACASLTQLSGGTANFVYRGTLIQPLQDGTTTIVIKHTEPYVASNPNFKLTSTRCVSAAIRA